MNRIGVSLALLILTAGAWPQQLKMPVNLDRLAAKASETTDITLNGRMLQLAAKFMNDRDDAEARSLVKKLRGIYVRSFQFEDEGEYSDSDIESVRSQLRSPLWEKIVGVRSKREGENAACDDHQAGKAQPIAESGRAAGRGFRGGSDR